MMKALYTSATGMKAHQFLLDVISNNLANVNTTGYKRVQVSFQDLLYDKFVPAGSEAAAGIQAPTGLQVGSGVRVVATNKVFSQGVAESTGRSLDWAIQGNGFFQITHPDGTVVSRHPQATAQVPVTAFAPRPGWAPRGPPAAVQPRGEFRSPARRSSEATDGCAPPWRPSPGLPAGW